VLQLTDAVEPSKRPTCEQLLQHPLFSGVWQLDTPNDASLQTWIARVCDEWKRCAAVHCVDYVGVTVFMSDHVDE
jgi:hypothetical protein